MSDVLKERGVTGTEISEANKKIKNELLNICSIAEVDDWNDVCAKIEKLWKEENGLKKVYEKKSMYQMPGSGHYFFNKAVSIGQSDYIPSLRVFLYLANKFL